MPTYNLTTPDGAAYKIDAPSEQAAVAALQGKSQASSAGQPQQSAPAQMAIGLLNTLPAAEQGTMPSTTYYGQPISSDLHQFDDGSIGYTDPKTGQVKMTNSATQVVLRDPTDGQLKVYARSPSTNEGPVAGVARVLSMGLGASEPAQEASTILRTAKTGTRAAPSLADLAAARTAAYNDPAVTSLVFKPDAIKAFAQNTDKALLAAKVDKFNAPNVMGIVDRLEKPRFGAAHVVDDLELARRALSDVPPNEARAAGIVRQQIDNYLGNVPQSDVLSGDAAAANAKLLEARGNNAAMERSLEVNRMMHNADVQSGSTYSGGNFNNAMRQQLRPLLKAKKGQFRPDMVDNGYIPRGMNADEAQQLARAVLGTKTGNAARLIGKMGPNGGVMGLGHLGMAMATHGQSIPYSMGGILARLVGNASTARQIRILDEMLRARSPLAESVPALAQRSFYPRGLLAGFTPRIPLLDLGVVLPSEAKNRHQ